MQGTDIVNRRQSRKDTASFLRNKIVPSLTSSVNNITQKETNIDISSIRPKPPTKNLGKDLSLEFVDLLKKQGVIYEVLERKKGLSPKVIRINQSKCLIAHANLSEGKHWFGFRPDDIEGVDKYDLVILLCGDNKLEKKYVIPHEKFKNFVLKGTLVKAGTNYPDYQVKIFPNKGYIMKATGNPDDELSMNEYQVENW